MRISKKMLCCTATAYKVTGKDEDRNDVYLEGVELTKIYIVSNRGESKGAQGFEASDSMTLYYDCLNSEPTGYEFGLGDKIEFNNQEFFISSIAPFYTSNGLEHLEIGLK